MAGSYGQDMRFNPNSNPTVPWPGSEQYGNHEGQGQPQAMESSFPFINVDQSLKIDVTGRSIIRTQVMQDFYKKARQSQSHSYAHGLPERPARRAAPDPGTQMKRFRLMPTKLQDTKKPLKQRFGKATYLGSEPASRGLKGRRGDGGSDPRDANVRNGSFEANQASDYYLYRARFPTTSKGGDQEKTDLERERQWYLPQLTMLDYFDNVLDPFDSLPGPNPQRKALLIRHYFQNRLSSSWLMIPMRKTFFVHAMQDLAWFYSAMSHYAGMYNLIARKGDSAESLVLRTQAIEVVNGRLGDPENEASDATIGAIVSMITYEANNGSIEAVETHVEGVKKMIKLRGGIEQGDFAQPVLRLIAWADVTASSATCSLSNIIPPKTQVQDTIIHTAPTLSSATNTTHFNPFVLSRSIPNIIALVRSLNASFHTYITDPVALSSTNHIGFTDSVYLVCRSLIQLCLNPQSTLTPIDRACCLATATFVDSHLRDMTLYARLTIHNVSRLKDALEITMPDIPYLIANSGTRQRLLWTTVFGGIAAIAKPERPWFAARLAELCMMLGLSRWENVQRAIEDVLWEPSWEIDPGSFWNEVQLLMAGP